MGRVIAINTLDRDGRARFIHSGTYEELIEAFGLTAVAHRRRTVVTARDKGRLRR